MKLTPEQYDAFVRASPQRSIYCYSWWLDAVAPGRWSAAIAEENGVVQALLPYSFWTRKGMARELGHPPLAPMLGPLLRDPSHAPPYERLSAEKQAMTALVAALPPADAATFQFHHCLNNGLPFHWLGFRSELAYTFVLEGIRDEQSGEKALRSNVLGSIRKARKSVEIRYDLGLKELFRLHGLTFGRQGKRSPLDWAMLERVDAACAQRGCREMLFAVDEQKRVHAGAYLVWDDRCAYFLMAGADPELRASGAQALVLWAAIRRAAQVVDSFDFEGSMVEPIEYFFRGFGGNLRPILRVSRRNRRAATVGWLAKGWRGVRGP